MPSVDAGSYRLRSSIIAAAREAEQEMAMTRLRVAHAKRLQRLRQASLEHLGLPAKPEAEICEAHGKRARLLSRLEAPRGVNRLDALMAEFDQSIRDWQPKRKSVTFALDAPAIVVGSLPPKTPERIRNPDLPADDATGTRDIPRADGPARFLPTPPSGTNSRAAQQMVAQTSISLLPRLPPLGTTAVMRPMPMRLAEVGAVREHGTRIRVSATGERDVCSLPQRLYVRSKSI